MIATRRGDIVLSCDSPPPPAHHSRHRPRPTQPPPCPTGVDLRKRRRRRSCDRTWSCLGCLSLSYTRRSSRCCARLDLHCRRCWWPQGRGDGGRGWRVSVTTPCHGLSARGSGRMRRRTWRRIRSRIPDGKGIYVEICRRQADWELPNFSRRVYYEGTKLARTRMPLPSAPLVTFITWAKQEAKSGDPQRSARWECMLGLMPTRVPSPPETVDLLPFLSSELAMD